jgi:D-glycero-D-manno-heptose 1,7-bisphosphate phosphatase
MKIVFLDRDGVINEFPGNGNYVTKIKDFHFIPGSLEAIRLLTEKGYKIFVISNQAGVGKGVYSLDKLNRINAHMLKNVQGAGGKIRKSFYCTHRSDAGCDCRKPGIGLLKKALKSLNKTITHAQKAFFVGDTEGDIKTGHNAGCKTIFSLSGREDRRYMRKWEVKPDHIVKDLRAAVEIILQNENSRRTRNRRGGA